LSALLHKIGSLLLILPNATVDVLQGELPFIVRQQVLRCRAPSDFFFSKKWTNSL